MKILMLTNEHGKAVGMNPLPGIEFGGITTPHSGRPNCRSWVQNEPGRDIYYVRETPAVIKKRLGKL